MPLKIRMYFPEPANFSQTFMPKSITFLRPIIYLPLKSYVLTITLYCIINSIMTPDGSDEVVEIWVDTTSNLPFTVLRIENILNENDEVRLFARGDGIQHLIEIVTIVALRRPNVTHEFYIIIMQFENNPIGMEHSYPYNEIGGVPTLTAKMKNPRPPVVIYNEQPNGQ